MQNNYATEDTENYPDSSTAGLRVKPSLKALIGKNAER